MSPQSQRCAIVDYGLGNLRSVARMVTLAGGQPRLVGRPEELVEGEHLILPGVGAFDAGMRELFDRGFVPILQSFAQGGTTPFLGICLGMQLLFKRSDEGTRAGLGVLPGEVERFSTTRGVRIPHMGWNTLRVLQADRLLLGLERDARFYFVHSYHVVTKDLSLVCGTTDYGGEFPSIVRRGNIMGAQFHPEKSHRFGKQFLRNFLFEVPAC